MKLIEILVSPTGQTKVETKGFVGAECKTASQFLEVALGQCTSEQLTAAFYETQSTQNTAQENA